MQFSEVELYAFKSSSAAFYLTPQETHVYGGIVYKSCAISRGPIVREMDGVKSHLDVRIPYDHALVRHLLQASHIGAPVGVRVVKYNDAFYQYGYLDILFLGRVRSVEIVDREARITCETAFASTQRIGLRRLYSRQCPHVLYSAACGAQPISGSAEVVRCIGTSVELASIPPAVSGSLPGGWLKTAGLRYMIVSESESTINLLLPAELPPNTVVQLYAGCDRTIETCESRFHNLDNYGGFPWIPTKNPFATGIY